MNMKMISALGLLVLLLFYNVSHAQNKVINGKVTDAAGNGIPGVSVTVKGETRGTSTASDGSYSISVPAQATTLVLSSVGYSGQEISIAGRNSINTTLQTTSGNLN